MTAKADSRVHIRTLTRQEAEVWQAEHAHLMDNQLYDLNLPLTSAALPDQVSNILAYDGDRVVGKIAIAPCVLKVHDTEVPCITSGDLYVESAYRDKAVGSLLIFSVLGLNRTWIFGGASTEFQPLLLRWKRFKWIDDKAVYYLPLGLLGAAKMAGVYVRNRITGQSSGKDLPALPQAIPSLAYWRRPEASATARALPRGEAIQALRDLLGVSVKPFQVPHNIQLLERALEGRGGKLTADMLCVGQSGSPYLVTMYPSSEKLGIRALNRFSPRVSVATLNEIFPPPEDVDTAASLLAFSITTARKHGADIVKLCGMNESICQAAHMLNALPLLKKTVFAVFAKDMRKAAPTIEDSQNWWCRAVNEIQFSETASTPHVSPDYLSAPHTRLSV